MTVHQPDNEPLFQVIATGNVLAGFDPEQVRQQLEQRLKLPAATATRLLAGKPVILKRDLPAKTAEDYCNRLRSAGLAVDIRAAATGAVPVTATPVTAIAVDTPQPPPPLPDFFPRTALEGLIPTALRLRLFAQTLRLLATPLMYVGLLLLIVAATLAYAAMNASLLRTPPLFFSLPVYLLPLLAGLTLIAVLLRPLLPLHRQRDDTVIIDHTQTLLRNYVEQLCARLGAKPPQQIRIDLSTRARIDLHRGRDGWQRGHYDLTIGLPLLQTAEPNVLAAALAAELIFAHDAALLRTRVMIASIRHWLRRHCRANKDALTKRLAERKWPLQLDQLSQGKLGLLFKRLEHHSSRRAECTLIEISDRAAAACAGADSIEQSVMTRYRLQHAAKLADQKNHERRIDHRLIDNLVPLIVFYYAQSDVEFERKLARNIESGAAAQSNCGETDRDRFARAPLLFNELSAVTLSKPTLQTADALGAACTALRYRNAGHGDAERLPYETLVDEALLDLEQNEAGKIYFNGWLIPARGWQLPAVEVLREIPHADAREQLNVCVNEVRRLTPDRIRLLNEFKRLQVQLNELLLGQQVLAAQHAFQFRYFKYDGTSLAPIIEQRQRDIGKILDQLATQESIMGGRIGIGLKLFGQDSAETENLHRTLSFLGEQEKALYRLEQDTVLLEQLLERQRTLKERGYDDAVARLAEKVQDAAMRLLDKLKDAPNPPDRRYSPLRAFFEYKEFEQGKFDISVEQDNSHAGAVVARARMVLDGFYTLNEKLSLLAAEQASSVEEAYRIERIRLVNTE